MAEKAIEENKRSNKRKKQRVHEPSSNLNKDSEYGE